MATPADVYHARMHRVLEHIDEHLDGALGVERLAAVAAFSTFHFHRQFSALYGLGVYQYVQRVRLRRAANELAFRPERRILDVALDAGYESHEAFSRAFKRFVGQTPSSFRQAPQWSAWQTSEQPVSRVRSQHMLPEHRSEDVRIVDFPPTPVAVLRHRGAPARLGESLRRFIEWRKENKLPPRISATFNVLHDDPTTTPPDDFRFDLCAATSGPIADNPFGVTADTLPGGRCAVLRHTGSDDTLGASIHFLYATWLPASGEAPRDFPLFVQRVRFFPDVPEHEAVVDVFLPLA